MAALARATALAPVVAHQGVARRSYGARVPAMASRVPSANLAAPLRSVGGKQVRIARPDRRAGCRQNLTLANPQRRCAFPAVRCARGWSGPTRDSDGPIDPWTTRATPIEHLHSIARALDRHRSRRRTVRSRARHGHVPAAWKSQPRDVSSPLCGGDVTPSPRPPRARVPLTPIIADREPHPVSPTNRPPCPPSWASRSPRRCPGERPARPNPQDAFVTLYSQWSANFIQLFSTVNLASRLWTDRSPRLNPTRHRTGSAAFDPRPPRRPQGPPPSSTSPRGSPTRAARLT